MQPFKTLSGVAAPLPMVNVDTDMIIPKQFLKTTKRTGLASALFFEMRTRPDGSENPNFVLNKPAYQKAQILVAGANFGCGSSREHAPWALLDFGIRCVIAPSFADIFYNNCFKNGILPVTLSEDKVEELFKRAESTEGYSLTADLPNQIVYDDKGLKYSFDLDPFRKYVLLKGLDDIGLTLVNESDISAYEKSHRTLAESFSAVDMKVSHLPN